MNRVYHYGKMLMTVCMAVGGIALTSGCGGQGDLVSQTQGPWNLYNDALPMGVTANPAQTISGGAKAWWNGSQTTLTIDVAGLPPNQQFGSHLHKLDCVTDKAGGHYQHQAAPTMEAASTPMYANTANEVWLDFTTDATGKGLNTVVVDWQVRAGEAKSIIIHEKYTDMNGKAGAKYACIAMPF